MLTTPGISKLTKVKKKTEKLSNIWEKLPERVKNALKQKLTHMIGKKMEMAERKKEGNYE